MRVARVPIKVETQQRDVWNVHPPVVLYNWCVGEQHVSGKSPGTAVVSTSLDDAAW